MKSVAVAVVFVGLALVIAVAQQNVDNVKIATQHVAGPVHMLEGSGGNIGVSAGPDGILIIDDQYAPLAPKIEAALRQLNSGALKLLINTHYHGDHTGGNEFFGRSAPIIAHINVRERLKGQPPAALPVITFDDAASVHFNGEEIQIVHVPTGHTDGDSVIFFTGSNVVHMGDHFFKDRFPFIDIDSGGNAVGMMRNVGQVLDRVESDARIIPGHGALATVDDLRRYHAMLGEMVTMVTRKRSAGKTLEQIQAEGVPSKYDSWGTGFINAERWLESVYRSVS
jgi:cyclase